MKRTLVTVMFIGPIIMITPTASAATTCHPSLIVHRAASAAYDEESVNGVRLGARWGWGSELDARVTSDGYVVGVHDRRLSRISGHTSDLQPETSTLAELTAVTLAKGGHIATIRQLIHAARRSHSNLMIEVKDYPTWSQQWDATGLPYLNRAIRAERMRGHVFVGSAGSTAVIAARFPGLKTFWRADRGDNVSVKHVRKRGYDLVGLDPSHYSAARSLRAAGVQVSTRTVRGGRAEVRRAWRLGVRVVQAQHPALVRSYCRSAS